MGNKRHSLGFQALNQARSAFHARSFLAGYLGLAVTGLQGDPDLQKAFYAYDGLFTFARKAMREMAIINVASVLDKQENSTGMIRLVEEVRAVKPELEGLCADLETRLSAHLPTFKKAVQIRSNIIAHRSRHQTYNEVHEKADLTEAALGEAIEAWLSAAQDLSIELRGEPWRGGPDAGEAATRLLTDIAAGFSRNGCLLA